MEKIFVIAVTIAAVINVILTIGVPLITSGINFVFRSDLNGWYYQELKEGNLDWYSWSDREGNMAILDFLIPTVVILFLPYLLKEVPALLTGLVYIVAFLLTLPLLRWLVDVSRNLRIKKDTGDSAKLQEIQNEIEELKQSIASSNNSTNTNNPRKG